MTETLPKDLEGDWRDSKTGSTLYARFLGDDLVVPYSYGNASDITGVFFDFRRKADDILFARFRWADSLVQGFAYMERSGSDSIFGGWWHSKGVPREALEELQRFDTKLPRMNDLNLSRLPQPEKLPKWVNDFFSRPRNKLFEQLQTDI